ncbi:Tfp pilus assembly protein PilB [Candidatus Moduliflexus flocculans]|uniref:Tfp pilus assembly protein PilB n=1 Tax=Candidatus Moduliflexus flocculans TaxID=1499966 RepID=A0A0S6VUC6_9BACT|nr:Tfp pilus assembly protein PilB [Candidatus Moduliflexus flocculans]
MAKRKRLGEVLVDACIISEEQLQKALDVQRQKPALIGQILVNMGWVSEEEICRAVAELLNVEFVDVDGALVSQEVVQLASEELASQRNILPLFVQNHVLFVAMENPLDVEIIQRLEFSTGMQVKPLIAPPSQLRQMVKKHYNVDEYLGQVLQNVAEKEGVNVENEEGTDAEGGVDVNEIRKASEGSQVIRLANMVIADGIKKRASDIHLEPSDKYLNVRYRIDGLLSKGLRIPKWLQLPLTSRIKVIAGLDIAEHRKPQDGRIRVNFAQRKIDLRVSTLLTHFGEKIVIRILDKSISIRELPQLGMSTRQLHLYRAMLRQPQGWVLVTGPTGCGKTTTLYASLNAVKDGSKNIVTVEDPIEYQLEGINQTPVNPKAGLTFAKGLRAILRQDPNIILVGEIRDPETAEIAMQAAETGHLVLSTLHTNDAISTVNRLFSLGVSPDLVAANLLIVIAQRLVRKICPQCKVQYPPSYEELERLGLYAPEHVGMICHKGRGCALCNQTGYYGQTAIYELLVQNEKLRDAIAQRASKQVLKRLARSAGMTTLLEDGLEKVRSGLTTLEEVARVCPVDAEETRQMLQCPQCGHLIAASDDICPGCQHTLRRACSQCQAALNSGWNFCPFCGARAADENRQIASAAADTQDTLSVVTSEQHRALRVLIAEDDEPVRQVVSVLLNHHGFHVIEAVDGEEALDKIRAELPDLILLDIDMPKQNGLAVCKAVRSAVETMFIPVIMLTAQDSLEEKTRGLACGADEYITKPFDAEQLIVEIEAVLQRTLQAHREEPNDDAGK